MDRRRPAFRRAPVVARSAVLVPGGATTVSPRASDHQGHESPPLAFGLGFLVPGADQVRNGLLRIGF
jgi:hypothetical protein